MALSLKEFQTQLKEVVEENEKLSNMKGRYVEYAQKLLEVGKNLRTIADELNNLSKEIDPVLTVRKRRKVLKKRKGKKILNELFDILMAGTNITMDFVTRTYTEINAKQAYYLLLKLSKLPGVQSTKDKGKLRLFYHRTKTRPRNMMEGTYLDDGTYLPDK